MSMIKGLNIIRKWVMSKMMKKSDDGIMVTLPDSKKVDLNTNITADTLLRNGVDIEQLTNPNQVNNLINQINKSKTQVISQDDPRFKGIMDQMMGKKGEVFDMTGKKIKPGSKIMGGEAVDDLPPPGSRGGPDDIAAPVQSAEESLKDMIMAQNKKNIAKIKKRKKMLDDAIEDASPGFSGDKKVDAELVAENLAERRGLVYDDLPTKERLKIYDEAFTGLSKKKDIPDDFATGGRVGLKNGSILESLGFTPEHSAAVAEMDKDFSGSQFDYAAAATRDMVDRASNPLTAAISAAGNVVGRPFYDAVDAAKEYSKKGYQGDFSFTPQGVIDFGKNLASLGKEFVDQRPDIMMAGAAKGGLEGVIDRFNKQQTPMDPTGRNLFTQFYEDDPYAGIEGQTAGLGVISAIKGPLAKIFGPEIASFLIKRGKDKARTEVGKKIVKPTIDKVIRKKKKITGGGGRDTGGGGGGRQVDTSRGAVRGAQQDISNYQDFGEVPLAKGGRVGYKLGSIDKARRAFLKTAAGIGGGIAALKTGLLGLSKKAPEVVEKVPFESATRSEAPNYFFNLVSKIKSFGKKSKIGPQERVDEYSYIGKNGDQYTLTEDIATGDAQIVKDKMGVGSYGDKTFDTINDRTVMEYKAPRQDVDVETGTGTRDAAEYEEYKVEFDSDGTEAGADAIDEIVQKEIIEEAIDQAPSIKKASGGIARMLGE